MSEKINLILIVILFLLLGTSFYYLYTNLEFEKQKTEKIIIENYDTMNFDGMKLLSAECPSGRTIVAGGCDGEASWINVFTSKPVKKGESIYDNDAWECRFSQDKEFETGLYVYAICK
jgi:hypothetical protein